jgi:hypothetical protein
MGKIDRTISLCSVLLLFAALGQAQERGHAAGVLGWTFGEQTAGLYGFQVGAGLGRGLSVVGKVEKLNDTLTGRYALFLSEVSTVPGIELSGKIPGNYYGGGLRWTFPGMNVSPFAQFEIGATKLSPDLLLVANGEDVTSEVFPPGELDTTAFTFVLGAGIRGDIGTNFLVEAAFEFFDINTDEDIRLNRLSFAFGVRF